MRMLFALTLACLIGITCWAPCSLATPEDDPATNGAVLWPATGVTLTVQGTLHEGKPDEHLDAGTGLNIHPGD